ncbi:hypothetical protein CRG98_021196 [Punica granatum]|uniref:G-patch domain-containing protein n=1 Tax=Punica granatum TaxID=22663 RepID=A0A2I0JQ61_PUNGR|nr:hypothetical protein CRG98_021196 [Punica granatum]
MISICASGRDEDTQDNPLPFVIDYTPEEPTAGFTGNVASPAPFVIDIPAREPYSDGKVPWTYEGSIRSVEQQFSVMGVTRSGRVYENPAARDKGKAPATEIGTTPESSPFSSKRVIEEEAEAFMKIVKASEYKVVEQMAKSPAISHCSPSSSARNRTEKPSSGQVNGEIDLLIDVGSCSFSITFQVLDIPNAFSLLLGRPWIHSADAIPSSLHQRLKFIIEEKLITVKGEEDYAIYKETTVPYISVGDDENLPFHSFEAISVIRDYGEIGPSRADRMIGKVLLRSNYVPGTGLGVRRQGISRLIEIEEYKHRRGLGFRPSYHEIIKARRGHHLHRLAAHYGRLNRGTPVPPLSHFFPGPSHIIGAALDGPSSDSDDTPATPSAVYAVTEEIPSGVHIRLAQEIEELDNWTSVPRYSAVIADVLHSNPSSRHFDSNLFQEHLGEPQPVYFREGLLEDSQVPEIEESLRRLEDHQITSVEPIEEINVGTEEEPRTLKIGTALDHTQRAQMIDFLKEYHEVFAWAIYYLSKKFTEGESNYSEIEKMCCALVWVMQRLRQYTLYHTIRLLSKADPLRYLLDSPSSMRNIAKWRCQLTEYDIEYVPRTSIKGQAIADHLAEFPIDDDTPINTDFLDEGILQIDEAKEEPAWKMYFDGAINSVGSGVGAVLISPDGRHYPVAAKVDFSCTNNVAEYEACILGLQAAIDFKVKELEVFGDSMLTNFQTLGQWKTKDAKLVPYHEYLEELAKNFEKISFTYTPRAKNQFADALATLASMASISEGNIIEPLEIEVAKGPAHCNAIEAFEAKPWYEDIRNFLQTGQYPPFVDRRDRNMLRRLAMHYFLSDEILYPPLL